MRVLLVGDTHGNIGDVRNVYAHACRENVDAIFQLGDFGFGWRMFRTPGDESDRCLFSTEVSALATGTDIPMYWLDGNHENFDFLECQMERAMPEYDGTYELAPKVFYVPRGTLLHWGETDILVVGGAVSVDKPRRTYGVSWWPQEDLTPEDVEFAREAGEADILLCHDAPLESKVNDGHLEESWGQEAALATYNNRMKLSAILDSCDARYVCHGHLHHSYIQGTETNGHVLAIMGLDCDGTPMDRHTHTIEV